MDEIPSADMLNELNKILWKYGYQIVAYDFSENIVTENLGYALYLEGVMT